jgi:hypothetical protein
MVRIFTLCLTIVFLASGCFLQGAKRDQPDYAAQNEAQQALNNKTAFQNNYDSLNRVFGQYKMNIDNIQAKLAGYDKGLSSKAKKDPQYPLIAKQKGGVDENYQALMGRHVELVAWADAHKEAPTTADVQTFSQRVNSLNQDLAGTMNAFSKLEIEYFGLKSRN